MLKSSAPSYYQPPPRLCRSPNSGKDTRRAARESRRGAAGYCGSGEMMSGGTPEAGPFVSQPGDLCSMHEPPGFRIEGVATMHRAEIVPHDQVADAPLL